MTLRSLLRSVAALCAASALFLPARASAQGITAGVKGGVNFSNVSLSFNSANTVTFNPGNRTGGIAGGFVGLDGEKAGFLIEVLWSQKGTKITDTEQGITANEDVRIDYIEVPIVARANFKSSDKVMLHVFGGPTFDFKASDKATVTVSGNGTTVTQTDDSVHLKSTDVGLTFGMTLDIQKFLIDARYTWGLININKDTTVNDPEVKNKTFSLMFGFKFK
jgi:hypothetical protein